MIDVSPTAPRFKPGQLVQHKRYRYRGVIVAVDANCLASDAWYAKNVTQPNRNQPWYHVLVDQASRATYVAESNLELDKTGNPIDHPLIAHFFSDLSRGHYIRNARPWHEW